MPGTNNGPSNGNYAITSMNPIVGIGHLMTFVGAQTLTTHELKADNLPRLNSWFRQLAGPGALAVQLEFADAITAGPVVSWLPLVSSIALVIGTPNLRNDLLGARRYRASITSTGNATLRYRLTASPT